jgi:hypothetical protein
MSMWAHPEWIAWIGAQPPPRPPGQREEILARVRHPSFTPELLDEMLRGLSRRQLRALWKDSSRLLDTPLPDDMRFNLVLLRERLIDLLHAA